MFFSRLSVFVLVIAFMGGCAAHGDRPGSRQRLADKADVSAVVAADLALARLAREKGLWQAFKDTMGDGAVMFVPSRVDAKSWLAAQQEPAQPAQWRPDTIVSACDGTLAASLGSAHLPDGSFSRYLIVWHRQRDGSYRWIVDTSEPVAGLPDAPEMIASKVAACSPSAPVADGASSPSGRMSDDRTFRYNLRSDESGTSTLEASYWTGEAFEVFYPRPVPAVPAG